MFSGSSPCSQAWWDLSTPKTSVPMTW
jgi:hypothetical protein